MKIVRENGYIQQVAPPSADTLAASSSSDADDAAAIDASRLDAVHGLARWSTTRRSRMRVQPNS